MQGLIVANLKLMCDAARTHALLTDCARWTRELPLSSPHLVFCPQTVLLDRSVSHTLRGRFSIGAQSVDAYNDGAHTGCISPASLANIGIAYALIGHVETKQAHRLTIQDRIQQIHSCLEVGIKPIICFEEHEAQELLATLKHALSEEPGSLIWAYEPAEAIGSDAPVSYSTITRVVDTMRGMSLNHLPGTVPVILYGGSCTPATTPALRAETSCDGLLVGRASTDSHSLKKIVSSWYTPYEE